MKRDVKLKRREMKREIKRLKEEIKALQNPLPCVKEQKEINIISLSRIVSTCWICEEAIDFAKEQLAHDLGKYILKCGFCTVTESDISLGHEIRISCEIVK